MVELSRRDFVRNGGAGIVALGAAGLAGCTSSLPGMGADGAGSDKVGSWLAEPALTDLLDDDYLTEEVEEFDIADVELSDREFDYTDVEAVFDNEEELVVYWPLEDETGVRDRTGIPAIDLDWQLSQQVNWEFSVESESGGSVGGTDTASTELQISVLTGSFDPDEIETALENWADEQFEDEGFSREGERDGYDRYAAGEYGFAVGTDHVIEVQTDPIVETTAAIEAVLDVRETGTNRWTDEEAVRDLLGQAGVGHLSEGELHEAQNREKLLAEQIEQRFGVETADTDELVAHRVEQRFGVATTDIDELLEHHVQNWYGVDDPDELSEREQERIRADLEQEVESIEDDVDRSLERIEDGIDIEDWEDGLVGSIGSFEIDGETTELTTAFLYESGSAADVEALREHVDINRDVGDRWGTLEDYEVEESDRVLVVSGSVRTRSLLF
ncbi:hypothetical protein [Natronococcus wangiae]|uniref:hypothetical protein n=1 Tax=Natronococcus wangiae TaxID=3068275 RepID=UPI00273F7093|nr:hypothetical protein [Natronococcus sp. AD5]